MVQKHSPGFTVQRSVAVSAGATSATDGSGAAGLTAGPGAGAGAWAGTVSSGPTRCMVIVAGGVVEVVVDTAWLAPATGTRAAGPAMVATRLRLTPASRWRTGATVTRSATAAIRAAPARRRTSPSTVTATR